MTTTVLADMLHDRHRRLCQIEDELVVALVCTPDGKPLNRVMVADLEWVQDSASQRNWSDADEPNPFTGGRRSAETFMAWLRRFVGLSAQQEAVIAESTRPRLKDCAAMTAETFAGLLDARRTGRGRWQARCPAHRDDNPSLSIAEGRDGRILVLCRAGCTTEAVVAAKGLSMRDLFAGPPPSPAQARDALLQREREEVRAKTMRLERIRLTDHYHRLWRATDEVGAKLAHTADDAPGVDALARLFHQGVEQLRDVETKLAGGEL